MSDTEEKEELTPESEGNKANSSHRTIKKAENKSEYANRAIKKAENKAEHINRSIKQAESKVDSVEHSVNHTEKTADTAEQNIRKAEKAAESSEHLRKSDTTASEHSSNLKDDIKEVVKEFKEHKEELQQLSELERIAESDDVRETNVNTVEHRPKKSSSKPKKHLLRQIANIKIPQNSIINSAAKKGLKFTYRSVKRVGGKVDPLNKPINKNEVTDTGAESLRLTKTTIKKTKSAVKTTRNTVATVKNTARTTAKVAQYSFKFVYEVAAQAVAIVINPIFLVFAAIVVIIIMLFGFFMLLIGGQSNSEEAMTTAEGLVDVADQYKIAEDYYNKALADRKKEFTDIIDNMYYNNNDREHSDLVYFKKIKHNPAEYLTDFADADRKDAIKKKWDYLIDDKDLIAIAYVWLEQQENTAQNSYLQIYEVTYTEEVFKKLFETTVQMSHRTDDNQRCPTGECARDPDLWVKKQEYEDKFNACVRSFDEWWHIHDHGGSVDDWWNKYGWLYNRYPYFDNDWNDYSQYIGDNMHEFEVQRDHYTDLYNNTLVCTHHHKLHSVGLSFWTKEDLMESLGFDETYKYWVELTVQGFNDNPNIP